MTASKIAITIDDNTLKRLDTLVKSKIFQTAAKLFRRLLLKN